MILLQFRIFHPTKSKGNNLTLSEKVDRISFYLLIPIVICLLVIFNTRNLSFIFESLAATIGLIAFLLSVISRVIRFGEYENLSGHFEGNIIFAEEEIKIDNIKIPLNEIIELELFYFDFIGRKTDNHRSGPMYTNGTGNQIKIKTKNSSYECFFEIISETIIYNIEQYLYSIVVNKKLQPTKNHLDLVPDDFKDNKAFIALLNEIKNQNHS